MRASRGCAGSHRRWWVGADEPGTPVSRGDGWGAMTRGAAWAARAGQPRCRALQGASIQPLAARSSPSGPVLAVRRLGGGNDVHNRAGGDGDDREGQSRRAGRFERDVPA